MPAVEYNIEIDENRNNTFTFIWFDSDNVEVDLTGMGAIAEIVKRDGTSVSKVTDAANITLFTTAGNEGKIQIVFPKADLVTLDEEQYYWELLTFPTSGSPTVDPEALLKGKVFPRKERASLS